MKLAIVHDYLNQMGGAERVVMNFHEIFLEAPIYTTIYIPENLHNNFRTMDIRPSFMQKLPFLNSHFKKYLLLYPKAIEFFDLKRYDVILSSSSAFAKGIKKGDHSYHICYCHTPMRFVWNYDDYISREEFGPLVRIILPLFIRQLKKWDINNIKGVDDFIANSDNVKKRILNYYNREADVLYPPVDTKLFHLNDNIDDYFLIVSRLNSYKRIDVAIQAFNELGYPLKIIGDGPYGNTLRTLAKKNVEFLGKVNDKKRAYYYSRCKALIFPGEEDFGIVPLESMASGRPVIAYAAGGALETVVKGETGEFFYPQTTDALIEILQDFYPKDFDPLRIRKHAEGFDAVVFKSKLKKMVEEKYRKFKEKKGF